MKTGAQTFFRRFIYLAAAGILAVVLTACTGTGGGYLPPGLSIDSELVPDDPVPDVVFSGQASFGFDFSCERSSRSTRPNPPTGQLRIQLSYTDHGTSPLLDAPFSIHGIVDRIDPLDESAICIGQNPPPDGIPLIFVGRYRPTTSPPPGFAQTCPARETKTTPLCRFEVIVQDNDRNLAPSEDDFFSIRLSSATAASSDLDPLTVFYARAGYLEGGNLTVK